MSNPKPLYVHCQSCRSLAYHVLYEATANLAHVICSSCNKELMSVAMAPPEEPLNTRVAPI